MYKKVSILFILAGVSISIWAVTAPERFDLDVLMWLEAFPKFKFVWTCLLGLVLTFIGILGVMRDRRAKAMAGDRTRSGVRKAPKIQD